MTPEKRSHQRRSIRLSDHDYAGDCACFVTICARDRACLFGEVSGNEMCENAFGRIVREEWEKTAVIRPYVELDAFVIMPNHFHGILIINHAMAHPPQDHPPVGATAYPPQDHPTTTATAPPPQDHPPVGATWQVAPTQPIATRPTGPKAGSLGAIMAQFKRITTIRINQMRGNTGATIWQRNYYDRVIRSESSLNVIRAYIETNPARWERDPENPATWCKHSIPSDK